MKDEPLFGRWMQRRRNSLNLTQDGLANLVHCSTALIRKIEADERRPSERIALRLAEHLAITPEERGDFLKFARGGWSDTPIPTPNPVPAPLPWQEADEPKPSLPVPLTAILGREKDVRSVIELLQQPDARLLTLSGPGGTGKTRLALEAAHRSRDSFSDGVHFAMLADLREPQHLPSAIARLFGIQETGSRPVWERVKDYLHSKQLLLVLDNFEQIVSAAAFIDDLLQSCARLRVLVTSREVLRLAGEHEFPVPPLDVPEPTRISSFGHEELATYPAVELFVQRAREARPDFRLDDLNSGAVARICSQLDGLPLAIELAAARIRILSPPAMLSRLTGSLDLLTDSSRNAPERQRTMRQTIAWSYQLLNEEEKTLLRRLSVFTGGFTLEAAEEVARPQATSLNTQLLDTLASLVQKSLVRGVTDQDSRFALLETIREFGLDELAEHDEETPTRQRHLDFYTRLMSKVEPMLHGPEQSRWMRVIDREHANIRSALRWSLDKGDSIAALQLAASSWWYWYVQGHVTEGRNLFREILAGDEILRSPWAPMALIGAARLAVRQNDDAEAEELFAAAERLARTSQDEVALVRALQGRARAANHRRELSLAREHALEALKLARANRLENDVALCLNELGEIARSEEAYDDAAEYYEESLVLLRALGDQVPMVSVLSNLGYVAQRRGELALAASRAQEGLRIAHEVNDVLGIATSIAGLAGIAALTGHAQRAARLFGAAETIHTAGGLLPDPVDQAEMDRNIAHAKDTLSPDEWGRAFDEGRTMTMEQAISTALDE